MRFAAASNSSQRVAWVARMVPLPGSARPRAALRQFMLLAVNMPEQEPQVGQAERSRARSSPSLTASSPAAIMGSMRSSLRSKGLPSRSWVPSVTPASMGPPETKIVGTFKRIAASIMPGVILSQFEMHTSASAQWAFTMYSTLSAMSSRLGSEYSMPSCPIAMPSSTAMVLNSTPQPPCWSMTFLTRCPTSCRCTWPGTNWVKLLAMATIGLPKSESSIPVARHRARAPAMLRPWVEVRLRKPCMAGYLARSGQARTIGDEVFVALRRAMSTLARLAPPRAASASNPRTERKAPRSMHRLYLSDLDGTLLSSAGEVSERTRQGLEELLQEGLPFTVASARSHFSIRKLFGDLEFTLPIIEFNGAFLTDYRTGRHLEVYALGRALGEEVFDRITRTGLRPFVCSYDGREDCLHYDELVNAGMVWYEARRRAAGAPRRRRARLRDTLAEQVVSLTVMAPDRPRVEALRDELAETYGEQLQLFCYENEYSPGNWWLTIHHAAASKHIAMRRLREAHAPSAELVAFGDNVNDLLMLEHADVAVAVANAVEPVRAVADHVIGTNDEDSVVAFLEAAHRSEASPSRAPALDAAL